MPARLLRQWIDRIPAVCEVCGHWPSRPICRECTEQWAVPKPRCLRCATTIPSDAHLCFACEDQTLPLGVECCAAAVDYAYPWDRLLARLKFQNEPGWTKALARVMLRSATAIELLAEADTLVPIPLSTSRLASRGYNQAWLLASEIRASLWHVPRRPLSVVNALVRKEDTATQHELGRLERWRNLRDAFHLDPKQAKAVDGSSIVLVDDVTTTGATLQAAAEALRMAGAARVNAVVLCSTPRPNAHFEPLL